MSWEREAEYCQGTYLWFFPFREPLLRPEFPRVIQLLTLLPSTPHTLACLSPSTSSNLDLPRCAQPCPYPSAAPTAQACARLSSIRSRLPPPCALRNFHSTSIPLSQRLRTHAAPRRVKLCDRSNIDKDIKVQPAAEDEDKQRQRQRMGIDDEDFHNGCKYVVSCASPPPHVCLILIVSPRPSLDVRPLPPRPFMLPPSAPCTPPMIRTTSPVNRALKPTRARLSPQAHACALACVRHLRASTRPHARTPVSATLRTAATGSPHICPLLASPPRFHKCSSPRVH